MADEKKGAVAETLKEVVEYVGIIIRYTASGFIGLLILLIAEIPTSEKLNEFVKSFPWAFLVIAIIIGLTMYSIHHTVLDALFNRLSIKFNGRKDNLYQLKKARRKRRASNEIRQKDMDSTFSLLNYLYCSSYLFIIIPLFTKMLGVWQNQLIKWWYVLGTGVFLLLVTFYGDFCITKEEFLEFDDDKTN
ncbi:MAG TPA: hypothetical protein PKY59_08270 [Pyrinomonadaceae bacterium]|nr:hypothetical protein [Pyrinomonadaceae bacterium]